MPGPTTPLLEEVFVPLGETAQYLAPTDLAGRILNLVATPEGTLRTVRGPTELEPSRVGQSGYPWLSTGYLVFQATLAGGMAPMVIVRSGTKLYRHRGGLRATNPWETLATGLSDDVYPLCSFGGDEDALLAWTAPSDGTYRFSTEGSGFNTVIALLDGCGGTEIACGNNQVGVFGVVSRDFVAGESVVIVIDSHLGETGPYTLDISQP